ncbi:MAG: alanine--tRNA ligase [Endomicrobiales bacterium]
MNSSEIRLKYRQFFEKNGHTAVPSDSLIPSGDPTLLFTSAGMVQFKKHFLGQSKDPFTRATTCQKCFRTSDIDQVGLTNRHLTFFEMLGNFSFGDYFKKDAIAWAWEFLTKEMALPQDKLYITVYKDDDEAFAIWKEIVPEARIIRLGEDTNFWNMGPTGPCGPCSEILVDLGPEMSCGKPDCGPACSCNRYLEVWNLVFTQFDRQEDGSLKNLPRKNIDTGMGLERLVAAASGKKNIFETDLFMPLIEKLSELLDVDYKGRLPQFRMMADHTRAIAFLIADGILPSNEGRGYVLRRILRRALRQGKLFGKNEPFLYKATAVVAEIMKGAYPELTDRRENIASITKMEEENFLETLESGTRILEDLIRRFKSGDFVKGGEALKAKFVIPGSEVFKLYDTYGFPVDLTKEIARENGLEIDEVGFAAAQKQAQGKSRAAWSGSGEKDSTFYSGLHKRLGDSVFVGYEKLDVSAMTGALLKDGREVSALKAPEEGEVILSETPFYAESGGQVTDTGELKGLGGLRAEVTDVQKPVGGLIVHKVKVRHGELTPGMKVEASVNAPRRLSIMRHHTATHLLHKALRQVLGTHVTQAGSLVTPDYFRFDFTHFAGLKEDELRAAEEIVNKAVRADLPVCVSQMKLEEARKMGAMALFSEKYGAEVRAVVVQEMQEKPPFSMELCGGTHVGRTGEIGLFKITSESSVAAGIRRIEAVAGEAAEKRVRRLEDLLEDIAEKLKTSGTEILPRIERLVSQQKEAEREISRLKAQLASGDSSGMLKEVREVGGVKVLTGKLADLDVKSLRELTDNLMNKQGSGIVILASADKEKLSFTVSVSDDLVKGGYHAGKIAKNFSALIEGSGGGKPDFAQGGGKNPSKLDAALQKAPEILK